jgi:anti-sigma B factor antagonist
LSLEEPCSPMLRVHVRKIGSVPVVEVSGEVDISTVPGLRSAIEDAAEQADGSSRLIVDLSSVGFIESMGLGLLVEQNSKLQEHGGALRLVLGEGSADQILRLAGLEDAFVIHPDLVTAVEGSLEDAEDSG